MGDDEYHPISHKGTNLTQAGGIGYTVIDSIDTMLIMGLQDEYERARQWVTTKLSFDQDANFNTFEVSVHHLTLTRGLLTHHAHTDHNTGPRWPPVCLRAHERLNVRRKGGRPCGPHHACVRHAGPTAHVDDQPREARGSACRGQQGSGQHCGDFDAAAGVQIPQLPD